MTLTSIRAPLLLASIAAAPAPAQAQAHLDWNAPSSCPSAAAVQSAIDHAAGPVARSSTVRVEAEVEPLAGGYELTLVVQTDTDSSRERLVASDCSLFVRLIALKVSLLATEPEPTTPSRQARAAAVSGSDEHTTADTWSLRAQAFVATTPVPAPAFGVALGAGYRSDVLRLELLGSYLFPRERAIEQQPDAGGTFQAWSAAARACAVSPWPRADVAFELAGCGGIEGGLLRGSGYGVSPAKVTDQAFLLASAGLSATVPLSALVAVRADVEAMFGWVRPEFFVRNLGAAHRVASLGTRGFLGVELRWP